MPCSIIVGENYPASVVSSVLASSTVSTRILPAASSSRSLMSPTNHSSPSFQGGRHPVNRQKMAVVNPPGGKTAITDYEILAADAATLTALVLCHLHTGRTHQIRVHLHHKGAPLVGDPIYGKSSKTSEQTGRLMLHAWRLTLDHPVSGERMRFEAPIPAEYQPWVDRVENLERRE
jgi:hypothetical protein